MLLGILLADWVLAIAFVIVFAWLILFAGFLLNLKSPVNVSMYFQAMFRGREKSELRIFWKNLIFGIEYIIGIVMAGIIKSAWYPAQWIRKTILFVIFSDKKKERQEREHLADKPKKEKDNGGVY